MLGVCSPLSPSRPGRPPRILTFVRSCSSHLFHFTPRIVLEKQKAVLRVPVLVDGKKSRKIMFAAISPNLTWSVMQFSCFKDTVV
ncbi:hypothetical protein E2C01_066484 [Portunus trituberculatus]|uniref:Uncharacterized protein n=1 Tax=Portunus trituberculatus TaxID=210409 RepID=A0A5B7HSF8_PORTR|nr:hypothetical protein [Portunus trituberculatus]